MQTEKEQTAFMRSVQYKTYGLLAIKIIVVGLLYFYVENDPWMSWLLLAYLLFSLVRAYQMINKAKAAIR